jgi:hypothetical protein
VGCSRRDSGRGWAGGGVKLQLLRAAMILALIPTDVLVEAQRYSDECKAFRKKSRAWFARGEK